MLVAFECKFENLHTIYLINISEIVLIVSNIDSMRGGGVKYIKMSIILGPTLIYS